MKSLAFLVVAVATLAAVPNADARDYRKKTYRDGDSARGYERRPSRRSSTVDRQGNCQRDTGRSMDSLNLNHQCDREEFWARFNDYGDSRR
jgi:hypothetical protein